jgi:hypothetical protein
MAKINVIMLIGREQLVFIFKYFVSDVYFFRNTPDNDLAFFER